MMKSFAATMALLISNAQAGIYDANTGINQWLAPNCFFGIMFMLIFFWVCYCTLSALSQVQTPRIMLEKCIDWGNVEKTEEWTHQTIVSLDTRKVKNYGSYIAIYSLSLTFHKYFKKTSYSFIKPSITIVHILYVSSIGKNNYLPISLIINQLSIINISINITKNGIKFENNGLLAQISHEVNFNDHSEGLTALISL